ncbi:MAG: prolipoprotein diacylglyceryl transferase family protein [Gemmataceae bacterium]
MRSIIGACRVWDLPLGLSTRRGRAYHKSMQQILFHVPFTESLAPPLGFGVPGFGIMLFLAFLVATAWGGRRAARIGLPPEKSQDLALVLFLSGIAGARVLYMIQYAKNFPDQSPLALLGQFFSIWEGGIVFYGSVIGGVLGYLVFRRRVMRPLGINGWQLADAVAPIMAIGMAIGRIGCYLNGCCWGQVACEESQPVPITARLGEFPLMPAHMRGMLLPPAPDDARMPHLYGLQTNAGFSIRPRLATVDPRMQIETVEPGSAAAAAGVQPGDRIISVNGLPNRIVVSAASPKAELVTEAEKRLVAAGGTALEPGSGEVAFASLRDAATGQARLFDLQPQGVAVSTSDEANQHFRNWPRGQNWLDLGLVRGDASAPVQCRFTPRTMPFFPTQIYETVSMILLCGVLLAFQGFRRHDGQVMVVLMLGYSVHRFLNEAIRIEPTYALGLTLSQWISVVIFVAAILLELYLRKTQQRLPAGWVPVGQAGLS